MNPELSLEVPDTPVRSIRPVNLQPGRSNQNERTRNLRLSHRTEQPIDLSSPTPPKDTHQKEEQRKRKSPSSVISIAEGSNPESRCSKKGKSVVQEVEDETCRRPTYSDNKGKGKLDARVSGGSFQDLSSDQHGLNSPPRRLGQRLLVRSGVTAPSNTARRDAESNHGSTEGAGAAVRDNKGRTGDIQEISTNQSGPSAPPRPVRQRYLVRNGVIAPRNVAERSAASNNGIAKDGASAPESELEAGQKVTVAQPSDAMQSTLGGQGSRPAGSSSVGAARADALLSEIVTDDPCRRVIRSRRELGATAPSNTSSWRSTQSNRPGQFNQSSSGNGRSNLAVSTASVPVAARQIPGVSTSANTLGEIGARPQRGLGGTAPSNTTSWRSTHRNRPGQLNQPSTESGRSNPGVSTASVPLTARPDSGASTSTNRMGEIGFHPQRGRMRASSSLYQGGSSSMTWNLGARATNLTAAAREARIRRFESQGAVFPPVIDVDEIPSPDSGASVRARQLAYDEMIARQLQEELYNDNPGDWDMEEIEQMDVRIAMSLQQEENAMHSSPIRQRASRAARPAQFVAASSLVRNNVQMQRNFNSHDYEELLALDEDNHQHTGASTSQINTLPESIVKSSNLDESCAVCLETPSIGEIIRHLPCFHKFHKDCIDLWLQRKKECPICKCSIF